MFFLLLVNIIIESDRIHCGSLIEFFCVNIYIHIIICNVTRNLRKVHVITFTENYRESRVKASQRCFS